MTRTAGAEASSQTFSETTSKELDVYAAEFAKLVAEHTPHRGDPPSTWLGDIPGEAFHYYRHGLSTFGNEATTPVERRGRLYLIHTSLLFMWMSWGRETARKRFQSDLRKGTRRTALLVKLEYYRRAGLVVDYDVPNWFYQPVSEWTAALVGDRIPLSSLPDGGIKRRFREQAIVECGVTTLASLQESGIIPPLSALSLA